MEVQGSLHYHDTWNWMVIGLLISLVAGIWLSHADLNKTWSLNRCGGEMYHIVLEVIGTTEC